MQGVNILLFFWHALHVRQHQEGADGSGRVPIVLSDVLGKGLTCCGALTLSAWPKAARTAFARRRPLCGALTPVTQGARAAILASSPSGLWGTPVQPARQHWLRYNRDIFLVGPIPRHAAVISLHILLRHTRSVIEDERDIHLLKWRARHGGRDVFLISRMKAMEEERRRLKRMHAALRVQADPLKEARGKK